MTDKQLGGMFSSATDEWATPQGFFDELIACKTRIIETA